MMPRRNPVGCVFWPIASLSSRSSRPRLVFVGDDHREVAGAVVDPVGAAHRARHPALGDRAAVDADRVDAELVDRGVAARLVLGVGRRRLDRLGDDPRGALGHQIEEADRLLDLLVADEVGDPPHLAGRHRDATNECAYLHGYFFRSPLWPWNVRVRENSPSLWPTICSVMNTGMNLRPLWMANVSPTIDGMTLDRREYVVITRRAGLDSLDAAAIFFAR